MAPGILAPVRSLAAFCGLVCSACNQLYGLETTILVDSPPTAVDAAPDAPIVCPPIGTVPMFSQAPRIIIGDSCRNYTLAAEANLAVAECNGVIVEGAVDSPQLAAASIAVESGHTLSSPRLSPDGSELFVTSLSSTDRSIRIYRRNGTQWVFAGTPTVPAVPANDQLFASTPSRGPARRLVVHHFTLPNVSRFDEWEHDGGDAWHLVRGYTPGDLGVTTMAQPALSDDARRLVFIGNAGGSGAIVRYADRADVGMSFGVAQQVDTPFTNVQYPYMTANCGRLYATGINTLVYTEQ